MNLPTSSLLFAAVSTESSTEDLEIGARNVSPPAAAVLCKGGSCICSSLATGRCGRSWRGTVICSLPDLVVDVGGARPPEAPGRGPGGLRMSEALITDRSAPVEVGCFEEGLDRVARPSRTDR